MATQNKFAVKNGLDANNQTIQNIGAIDLTQTHLFDRGIQGRLSWNNDDETVDIGMAHGVIQQVGLEQYYHAKNQTGSTIPNGTVVRAAGTLGASGRILVTPAIADASYHAMMNMGVATHDIITGEDGLITNFGLVRQLDTTGTSVSETWVDGDVLYLHPTQLGKLTKNRPVAPNQVVIIAIVIHAAANGSLFVRVTQSGDLGDLHNVYTNGGADNGDVLTWVAANNRWEPQGIASALGRSTTQFIATAGQTVFNTTYNAGSINVFHNGVLLSVDDYTATNGTSITLTNAASVNDVIVVEKFEATSDVQLAVTSVAGRTGAVTLTKDDVGLSNVANVDTTNASNISTGTLGTARLGSGTANSSTYLRGDQTWQALSANLFSITTTATSKTLAANEYCTVTAAAQTITLPASPAVGMTVKIGVLNFVNTTVGRNSQNIMGLAENLTIDKEYAVLQFTYVDATRGWMVS